MAIGMFLDPAGTTPIVSALQFVQAVSAPTPADRVIYFGASGSGHYLLAEGGGDIVISVSGAAAGNVAMALDAAGLAAATPGAALVVGERVDGIIPIHLRALDTTHASGQRGFVLTTNTLEEWAL